MGNAAFIDRRVAVLVDCENLNPEILEFALGVIGEFGQALIRRGYGNHSTLANKWQDALVRHAFTPQLQYQYASGKNTSDIALALDALELMLERRADVFCLVTSDSDFTYLCRKLRERGAIVLVVGESTTPAALRNASDRFCAFPSAPSQGTLQPARPIEKQQPEFIIDAVKSLAGDAPEGEIGLALLGQELRRTHPDFSPGHYGHAGLRKMLGAYQGLKLTKGADGHYTVKLRQPSEEEVQ